jgi:hypothetical protein
MMCGNTKARECTSFDVVLDAQAVELLRQVAAVDPADYERQMTATAASVRAVGTFIAELADRCV